MPKLSDTMTVGTLVRWLKQEGEKVAPGDMLAEVETDKATMELENFSKGVLLKHYIQEGAQVPIGAPLCAIGKEGETAPDISAPVESPSPAQNTAPLPEAPTQKAQPAATCPSPVEVPTIEQALPSANARIKASPLAKKIAKVEGVSLETIQGSGPSGRIIRADVLNALSNKIPASTSHYKPSLEAKSLPVSSLRGTIARRLKESKQEIPHFYLELEVDSAPMDVMRKTLNTFFEEEAKQAVKLTVNDFILRACALALSQVPAVNTSWQETSIIQHGSVHLSFGVAIEDGLVTPVIRDAHTKSLQEISIEAKALIAKARTKKLKPDEMMGSTFTVTNLGMFGISSFHGIINPPNAGILSVGASFKKPVVNERDEIVIGQRMILGFSGDHRVIDGALGALFLSKLQSYLEKPALLLL